MARVKTLGIFSVVLLSLGACSSESVDDGGAGGTPSTTGGTGSATGGTGSTTGGTGSTTGGTGSTTGGTGSTTGGTGSTTGGTGATTGGTGSTTGGAASGGTGSGGAGGAGASAGGSAGSAAGGGGAGGSAGGTGGAGAGGSAAGAGGTGGPPPGACAATVAKGAACAATDMSCTKTCGPDSVGYKVLSCSGTLWAEDACMYTAGADYSCYKLPTPLPACPAATKASAACTAEQCMPCGPDYVDSNDNPKMGSCVCGANKKWSCASSTAWPPQ